MIKGDIRFLILDIILHFVACCSWRRVVD
jgi:hypothetical protein